MGSNSAKAIIQEYAKSLGFCEVGFAQATALKDDIAKFQLWLDYGFDASMHYLRRNLHKRENPELILPNCRTIIVCAFNYNTPFQHNAEKYKISRYAWGDDYHNVLSQKLKQIENRIQELYPDCRCKSYVDTGAILEKVWAVRAGIGWYGKNSLVLTKKYGSYVFFGLILTTAEFPPDKPIKDYCGDCNLCIENCPTGAIVFPKVVDSNRCISFWTIEAKANQNIPKSIDLNGWIFGCDICQEVCPWNKKQRYTDESAFYPRFGETNLREEFLERMDEEVFRNRFSNSPVRRVKFNGLKRNYYHLKGEENEAQQTNK